MKVEKIDDIGKLEMMRADWDALLSVNTTYSPFMTFDWIYNWWQYLGNKNKMFLLVAKSEGNIVGIAPLMISKLKYGGRQLGFMVDENVSRFDFLVLSTYREKFIREILKFIFENRKNWDAFLLNYFPCFSKNYSILIDLLNKKEVLFGENYFLSPYIRIDKSWSNYLVHRGKRFRKNIKKHIRISKEKGFICNVYTSKEALSSHYSFDNLIEKIFAIEERSWKFDKNTSIISSDNLKKFYTNIFISAVNHDNFYLGIMEKNNIAIAYDLNWVHEKTVFSLKNGYDKNYKHISPGNVLKAYTIIESILKEYDVDDSLGIIDHNKMQWTNSSHKHSRLHIYNNGLRSRIIYYYNFLFKKYLKALLSHKFLKSSK